MVRLDQISSIKLIMQTTIILEASGNYYKVYSSI